MKNYITCFALSISFAIPAFGQSEHERDLAMLDCAASTVGTIGSWIRNEPEAAIEAFEHHKAIRAYLHSMKQKYPGPSYPARIGDRMKAVDSKLKAWDYEVPKLLRDGAKQIETELKRTRDALTRFQKAKSKRVSSITYLPKSHLATQQKLDVLTAAGADTTALSKQCLEVTQLLESVLQSVDSEELAKKNGYIRDAYKRDDRQTIEAFVMKSWSQSNPESAAVRVVMPKQSWSNTYGARANQDGQIEPNEVDRMTVFVATKKNDEMLTLHPIRLARQNFLVNGKRLGKIGPQTMRAIPTHQRPMDVLQKNIR